MKLAYPAFAVAKANAKGKCCERRRRSRAQCLSACTGVVDCEEYHSFQPLEVTRHTLLSDKMGFHWKVV